MTLEEEFDIEIVDAEAASIRTIADATALVSGCCPGHRHKRNPANTEHHATPRHLPYAGKKGSRRLD